MLRVEKIEKNVLDGIRNKVVTVYQLVDNVWVYFGVFDVPARCGNKRLVEWICNNRL